MRCFTHNESPVTNYKSHPSLGYRLESCVIEVNRRRAITNEERAWCHHPDPRLTDVDRHRPTRKWQAACAQNAVTASSRRCRSGVGTPGEGCHVPRRHRTAIRLHSALRLHNRRGYYSNIYFYVKYNLLYFSSPAPGLPSRARCSAPGRCPQSVRSSAGQGAGVRSAGVSAVGANRGQRWIRSSTSRRSRRGWHR